MCKNSAHASKVVEAKRGETYGIGKLATTHMASQRFGAFVPEGETAASCVACVKGEHTFTFGNIPTDLQKKFHIGSTAEVTFIEGGYDHEDMIRLKSGTQVALIVFADKDITAFYGIDESHTAAGKAARGTTPDYGATITANPRSVEHARA